jgi:hypothetical protein
MTNALMGCLFLAAVVIAISSALEKRWPLCLYWVGAAIVTGSVLWMGARGGPMEISK